MMCPYKAMMAEGQDRCQAATCMFGVRFTDRAGDKYVTRWACAAAIPGNFSEKCWFPNMVWEKRDEGK